MLLTCLTWKARILRTRLTRDSRSDWRSSWKTICKSLFQENVVPSNGRGARYSSHMLKPILRSATQKEKKFRHLKFVVWRERREYFSRKSKLSDTEIFKKKKKKKLPKHFIGFLFFYQTKVELSLVYWTMEVFHCAILGQINCWMKLSILVRNLLFVYYRQSLCPKAQCHLYCWTIWS